MPPSPTAFEIVWRSPWVRAATFVVLGVLALWLLWTFRAGYAFALQVALIGFVIAYVLNPLVELLQRLRLSRVFAVVIVYVLLLNVLVLGSLLVTQVVGELGRFITLIPTALDNIAGFVERFSRWLGGLLERLPAFLADRLGTETSTDVAAELQTRFSGVLAELVTSINGLLEGLVREGPALLLSGATTILSTTFQVFLILLASAYFLYDFPKFTANFRRLVPLRWRGLADDLSLKADRAVGGYLRGQLLITLVLGALIFVGLSLLGIPLALAISFLAAIFNLVPYLGPIIGVIPAALLGFTLSPLTAALAVLVFVIANQLEGNLLSPMILSKNTNLHPVTVLLAILAGVGLFGLVGALLAVPTVALVKVVLEDYLLTRPAYRGAPLPATEEAVDVPERAL
mgnify:CR=1 FL=1